MTCWESGGKKGSKHKGIEVETEKDWKINSARAQMNAQTATLSLSSMETLSKYVEILRWNLCFENKRREGTGGITASSLSLRDHNDDKESITVLL